MHLTGGEGGPTLLREDFRAEPLGPELVASGAWTRGDAGLAGTAEAILAYGRPADDGELITVVRAAEGDRLVIVVRRPDARRVPDDLAAYELAVHRTAGDVELELVRVGGPAPTGVLGAGATPVGATPELSVRVRVIADRIRAWVFDRELIDVDLSVAEQGQARVRAGAVAWRVAAGNPVLREVQIRSAALLTIPVQTSRYRTFAEVARAAGPAPDIQSGMAADAFVDRVAPVRASQARYADARVHFEAVASEHRLAGASRQAVEQRRQDMVDAGAAHDAGVLSLLLALGAVDGHDGPGLRALRAADGILLGHLLRSPESWEPRMDCTPGTEPHDNVGRTTFAYLGPAAPETAWLATTDGTTVLVLPVDPAAGADATVLRVVHARDHGDHARSDAAYDHLHDRPYRRSATGRAPVELDLSL